MSQIVQDINRVANAWWPYVLDSAWQAATLGILMLIVVRLGRRWPAQLRHGLLLIALVKFAIPPYAAAAIGMFSRLGPTVSAPSIASGEAAASARVGFFDALGQMSVYGWLMIVHVAGAALMACWVMLQFAWVTYQSRQATQVRQGALYQQFIRQHAVLGLRRPLRLLVCDWPISPTAFGLWRRTLMLPRSVLNLPGPQLRTILSHELAHHQRGDLWVNWLQIVLQAAWWFNPVVWLVNSDLRRLREDCCDDMLLSRRVTTRRKYCQALLAVAANIGRQLRASGLPGFAESPHPLAERIRRIMDPCLHRYYRASTKSLAMMFLLGALTLPGLTTTHPASSDGESYGLVATNQHDQPASPFVLGGSDEPRPRGSLGVTQSPLDGDSTFISGLPRVSVNFSPAGQASPVRQGVSPYSIEDAPAGQAAVAIRTPGAQQAQAALPAAAVNSQLRQELVPAEEFRRLLEFPQAFDRSPVLVLEKAPKAQRPSAPPVIPPADHPGSNNPGTNTPGTNTPDMPFRPGTSGYPYTWDDLVVDFQGYTNSYGTVQGNFSHGSIGYFNLVASADSQRTYYQSMLEHLNPNLIASLPPEFQEEQAGGGSLPPNHDEIAAPPTAVPEPVMVLLLMAGMVLLPRRRARRSS